MRDEIRDIRQFANLLQLKTNNWKLNTESMSNNFIIATQ